MIWGGEPRRIRPWPRRDRNRRRAEAPRSFTFGSEKGCAAAQRFVKGGRRIRGSNPVNATPLDAALPIARSAGERALGHFLAAGFRRIEPAVLHPASIFLDMSGEDDPRPAVPDRPTRPARSFASGPSTRSPSAAPISPREKAGAVARILPISGRSSGRRPRAAASAPRPASKASAARTRRRPTRRSSRWRWRRRRPPAGRLAARLGDAGLFDALLAALALPEVWRRRLRRGLAQGREPCRRSSTRRAPGALAQAGVLAALESADHDGRPRARRGPPRHRRHRFGRRADAGRDRRPVPRTGGAALGRGDRRRAAAGARGLSRGLRRSGRRRGEAQRASRRDAGLDLGPALDAFETRNGFIAARGVAIEETRFSAAFVRDFDYYTGFVFEARDPARPEARPALAGGRYDGLARKLGATADIPAVGAAIALDRLPAGAR